MSVHGKIIAWLVVFGALIVVAFGAGDYIQSTLALRFALQTRAAAVATQVVEEVEHRHERAVSELYMVGYAVIAASPALMPPLQGRYVDVRVVRSADDAVVFAADTLGSELAAPAGCGYADVAFSVPVTLEGAASLRVEARMTAADFFVGVPSVTTRLGQGGFTGVVRASDGGAVYDAHCAMLSSPGRALLKQALTTESEQTEAGGRVRVVEGGRETGGAILVASRAPTPDWLVATLLDYEVYAAPFVTLRRQYITVVTGVLLLVLLAIIAGLRSNMRRLSAIARAADDIGRGRFDVWLPPPTGDEIGRVSLALGRMMDRLSTMLRRMEARRSMAAVGEMATYLSHEIRNPLSAVRLNLQMLRRDLATGEVPEDGEELVGLCLSELDRLEGVVKTVLEVGRTGRDATGACDAHAVITETCQVMNGKFRDRGIEVDRRLSAGDPDVGISGAALRSVVVNLLLNAMDAMADRPGGALRLTTEVVQDDAEGRHFEMRVSDNGPGVPVHLRERIFDPFFTTKTTGHGIGLATALRVVQECGGFLRYETAQWSGGAEFVLELPLARDVQQPQQPPALAGAG
jgi:signal transduction histidine kinase